jgi:hypothetical protein
MGETTFSMPSALLGQAVLFVLFILVVNTFLREVARIVIKVALVIGVGVAIAVMAGWLDQSAVGHGLEQVGEWVIAVIAGLVRFLGRIWDAIVGAAE